MNAGNGQTHDEGLKAIRLAFKDAQYTDADGKECANLMMLGAHRSLEVPDNVIVEVYASITAGKNVKLGLKTDSGSGYTVFIESYGDMIKFLQGTLEATAQK